MYIYAFIEKSNNDKKIRKFQCGTLEVEHFK